MSRTMRSHVSTARKPGDSAAPAEEIARVAYELFERRGSAHGHDQQDWFEAERIVREDRRRRQG